MKPHLIMPMGGAGSRFYKNGYRQPKPLIEINGKPFFYWAAMSITRFVDIKDLTFVILQQHIDKFKLNKVICEYFPDADIIVIPEVLPGPVFTSLKGVGRIKDDAPVIFNDCDHMFRCNAMNDRLNKNKFTEAGALLTFESSQPQFSYVKYEDGKIVGTTEKQVVSNHAVCGAYIFRKASIFRDMAEIYMNDCPYNECFMSGIYNVMCNQGMEIKDYLLDFHVEYGTPDEYEKAKRSRHFKDFE